MTDVLGVEPRQAIHAALERVLFPHIPIGDDLLAVGVGLHVDADHVVEQTHGFGIGAADHLVDHFHELLGADGLAGMQAAVDPDHGFALARQRVRLIVGEAFGVRQPRRDLPVVLELLHVRRRGDDHHVLMPPLFGGADVHQLAAIAFRRDLFPVGFKLGVGGHHVIVAEVESEGFFRRGDLGRALCEDESGAKQEREQAGGNAK